MVDDGRAMTDFLREYLQKDKITLFGHSMASIVAANMALKYPEKYDAVVTAALIVDEIESRTAYREYILGLTQNDPALHAAAQQLDPLQGISEQYDLYIKFSTIEDVFAEVQFSPLAAVLFNPYCTPAEQYRMLFEDRSEYEHMLSGGHPHGDVYAEQLSLKGRTEYQVAFYLVQGKTDHNGRSSCGLLQPDKCPGKGYVPD